MTNSDWHDVQNYLILFYISDSQGSRKNKCYVKYVHWKVFRILYKTMKESISSNIADVF